MKEGAEGSEDKAANSTEKSEVKLAEKEQEAPAEKAKEASPESATEEEFVQLEGDDAPAILITGAHHARELITVQQVTYLILNLLQRGVLNQEEEVTKMLSQNKFYFIPVVNVDGLALIEDYHRSEGTTTSIIDKRKNMS